MRRQNIICRSTMRRKMYIITCYLIQWIDSLETLLSFKIRFIIQSQNINIHQFSIERNVHSAS